MNPSEVADALRNPDTRKGFWDWYNARTERALFGEFAKETGWTPPPTLAELLHTDARVVLRAAGEAQASALALREHQEARDPMLKALRLEREAVEEKSRQEIQKARRSGGGTDWSVGSGKSKLADD